MERNVRKLASLLTKYYKRGKLAKEQVEFILTFYMDKFNGA